MADRPRRKRQGTVFKRQVLRFCRRQAGDFPAGRMGDNSPPKYPRTFETSALHHLLLPDGKRGAQPFGAFRRRAKTSRRQRAFVHDILPADNPRDSFNFVTTKQKAAFTAAFFDVKCVFEKYLRFYLLFSST